jgi:hypothetical protein
MVEIFDIKEYSKTGESQLIILGAGMAGLLAANMLSRRKPVIIEKQSALPNNHSAVLRFRSSVVGDVLGIEFSRVRMIKCTDSLGNPLQDVLNYSKKCTGKYRSDRSLPISVVEDDRYIAPVDLVSRMESQLEQTPWYSTLLSESTLKNKDHPKISTIPMPVLMQLLDYPHRQDIQFGGVPGTNLRGQIKNCNAYVTMYIPDPGTVISRVSITGDELIIECPGTEPDSLEKGQIQELLYYALGVLGLPTNSLDQGIVKVSSQQYSKILPINDEVRKDFLCWATDQFNIYSLGRYAVWRPGLLLDDLVKDIRLIDRWTQSSSSYLVKKHR